MKFGKFKPCNEYHFEVEATLATILGIKPCNEYHLEGTEHYEFRFKTATGPASSAALIATADLMDYLNWLYSNETVVTLDIGTSRMTRRLQATSWGTWKLTTS